ncbi:phenylacetate--CoA ligase family protein [Methanophagales archaeon]|nr:MAG: phenylacetate--CoA ligase family protein [Methanophagales archaeon]
MVTRLNRMYNRLYSQNSITSKALAILPSYKTFKEMYKFLQKSQWWSREQLEEYQLQQLGKLLNHAYKNVPYYKKVFDERGLKPKDIQDFKDLQKLPFLTKEIIQDNLNDLKARNYPADKFEYVTTGGSTGIPLGFYYERGVSRAREWAFMKTLWDRVGYHFRDKCVILRGNVVKSADKGKFWEYSLFGRWLILSSYHMTDENLPKYIEKIMRFKPKFIQAYPSAITILARFMRENNIEPFPTVKAILCGSENLYQWQRKLLEDVFQCRVYSWYGHTEQAVLAGECEKSTYYHIFPEYGIVEIIGKDGKPVTAENEIGEIVATGLNNFICPLIRYRTMDLAVPANGKCECGRDYPLLKKVEGRLQELVVAGDGSLIPLGPAIFGIHDAEWTKVKQIQFLQEKPGELIIQVVKGPSYSKAEIEDYVLRLFKARLEGQCKLNVRFVDHIPRTQRGKYRFLIQKLPIEFGGS